jgi:hypothetical protein
VVASAHAESTPERPPRFCVNYAAEPSALEVAAFEWSIVEPTARIDLKTLHRAGRTCLAYVSTVEARPDSEAAREAEKRGVPVIGRNDEWQSHLFDIEDAKWLPLMLDVVVPDAMKLGFDGVFLDTLDSAQRLPGDASKKQAALVALVQGIRDRYPTKKIVLNRGFDLIPAVAPLINGVLVESVFRSFDHKARAFTAVKPSDTEWLVKHIRDVQSHSLPVFVVDYVSPTEPALAMETAKKLEALGCSAFITTPDLDGINVGPMRQIARRILVVHGTDTAAAQAEAAPPIDTMAATHFQAVLEWMGYEFDFHDIGHKPLPDELPFTCAGVIVDELDCQKPLTKQAVLAWLQKVKARKVPILFAGDVPFADDDIRSEFAQIFGLGGSLTSVHGVVGPTIAHRDTQMMAGEIDIAPHRLGFKDLTAPVEAEVYLSLKGTDREGRTVRYDPCFMAPWGGVWLEPYIVFRASQANHSFYADVFAMMARWLHTSPFFPIPDTTTRDGRRIFYSHIDGDGFASLSQFPNHPPCAEVTRDRVLKKYPLPVTVSVVEVDVRGWLKTLKKEDSPRYVELARSMFALPHVQAGSHSFSHPFIWDATDPNPGHYDATKTTLADDIDYPVVNPKREIAGSIDYINQNLLPPGKQVELMLWSGNCRPGVAALRLCRELGVENMNGGDTIISKRIPSVAGVSPRLAKWGDEIQIFAANQNEFMYANGFEGPNFGGFAHVIDTFLMTEQPRRLKPVNVYYHFYSATYLSSCRALEQIMDWCMGQELHPITALQYASLVRDAHRTQIYETGPRSWRIANAGELRTFRLPAKAGTPDLAQCVGISGYRRQGDVMYVHTTSRAVADLVLAAPGSEIARWPFIIAASADLNIERHMPSELAFRAAGWDRVTIELGGLPTDAQCPIDLDERHAFLTPDSNGTARMTVSPGTRVRVHIPAPYATSR